MEILTYPIGLVVGMLPVVANLGPPGSAPAQLLLDGRPACTMRADAPQCAVDLGPDPRMHVLELRRTNERGEVVERTQLWVNRPGAQAQVFLDGACDKATSECKVSIGWAHPSKREPMSMVLAVDGQPLLREVQREFRFKAEPGSGRVVSVDIIFQDGRRASQTRALGAGYVGFAETSLQAIPVVEEKGAAPPRTIGGLPVRGVEDAPAEVAFVIEPLALDALRGLWTQSRSEMIVPGAPIGEQINGELVKLEAMTVVIPNENLNRFDMFKLKQGRDQWLRRLAFGTDLLEGRAMRLADAVASAGELVAGAPRRRAVVLVISGRHKDESKFTPEQACRYLSEIMVPLVVWRVESGVGQGWPEGPRITSRTILSATRAVRATLEGQRIAWVEGDLNPAWLRVHEDEGGVTVAGRVFVLPATIAAAVAPPETPVPAAVAPAAAGAAAKSGVESRVDVTAVRALIRPEGPGGAPVQDLAASEIEVKEDGVPARVLGLDRVGSPAEAARGPGATVAEIPVPGLIPWNVVIYVIPDLCTKPGLVRILDRIREDAPRLVSFGSVTVVLADPEPKVLAERITDTAALEEVVNSDALRKPGRGRLAQIRRDFLDSMSGRPDMPRNSFETQQQVSAESFRDQLSHAEMATTEELSVLHTMILRLEDWAHSDTSPGARVLFLAIDGFDLNPDEFYFDSLDKSGQPPNALAEYQTASSDLQTRRLGPFVQEVAAALAELRWTVVTFDNGITVTEFANSAEQSGHGKSNTFIGGGASGAAPTFLFMHPREPLQTTAETTGGLMVPPGGSVRGALDVLGRSLLLTYQVDRPADGRPHRVEVSCKRTGITITAPKLVFSGTAEAESEMRARRILGGEKVRGGLPLTLMVLASGEPAKGGRTSGELRIQTDLGSLKDVLALLGKARLRITVAAEITGAAPFVTHQEVEAAPPGEEGTIWGYQMPLTWPQGAKQVAVVVEELATGAWGCARMALPTAQ